MISPADSWHRFTDPEELLAFSKQLKLTPKTFTEPKPLVYTGVFCDEPTPCKLVGYVDQTFVVIEVAGQLHTIHPEYLLDMQSSPEAREKRTQTGFFDSLDDFIPVEEEFEEEERDPFEVPVMEYEPDFPVYTVIDIETNGLSLYNAEIIDLGAVRVENGVITDRFSQLVQPSEPVSLDITALTSITNDMLEGQPSIGDALHAFLAFIGDTPLVGHNLLSFDIAILNRCCEQAQLPPIDTPCCDTLPLARHCLRLPNHKLQTVAQALDVQPTQAHRALADCETTYACFEKLRRMSEEALTLECAACFPQKEPEPPVPSHKPKISQQDLVKFKSRPKAKDIHPTTDLFDPSHPLYDLTCVITGDLEQISALDAMQGIADCGGHNADNVTKKTDLLIIGDGSDPTHKSGKVTRAEEYIAKGQQIRIVNETEFLALLHTAAALPEAPALPQTVTDAARIYQEMCDALTAAPENYDLGKLQLVQRTPDKATAYEAIELFGQSCLNFKGTKTLYLEVSPKIEALLTAAGISLEADRANGWARVPASDVSFAGRAPLVVEIYEKYLMTNGFDCCSRYLACSEAGHCTHPDIMFAGQCTYRQKLRTGHIFYGDKRNV